MNNAAVYQNIWYYRDRIKYPKQRTKTGLSTVEITISFPPCIRSYLSNTLSCPGSIFHNKSSHTASHHTPLYCITLCRYMSYHIIPHLIKSTYTLSHHIISYKQNHITSYHPILHHIIARRLIFTSHHSTPSHIHITSYHITSHYFTSYHITSHYFTCQHTCATDRPKRSLSPFSSKQHYEDPQRNSVSLITKTGKCPVPTLRTLFSYCFCVLSDFHFSSNLNSNLMRILGLLVEPSRRIFLGGLVVEDHNRKKFLRLKNVLYLIYYFLFLRKLIRQNVSDLQSVLKRILLTSQSVGECMRRLSTE